MYRDPNTHWLARAAHLASVCANFGQGNVVLCLHIHNRWVESFHFGDWYFFFRIFVYATAIDTYKFYVGKIIIPFNKMGNIISAIQE